jgi:hypothetical protein
LAMIKKMTAARVIASVRWILRGVLRYNDAPQQQHTATPPGSRGISSRSRSHSWQAISCAVASFTKPSKLLKNKLSVSIAVVDSCKISIIRCLFVKRKNKMSHVLRGICCMQLFPLEGRFRFHYLHYL